MEKKYYAVTTKCGHVGRNKFIVKTFAISAEDGKEAAEIARWIPRVKHHDKYCVLDVKKISYEAFKLLVEKNNNDNYFKCSSIQEQDKLCPEIYKEAQYTNNDNDKYKKDRRDRVNKNIIKNRVYENDYKKLIKEYKTYDYEYAM